MKQQRKHALAAAERRERFKRSVAVERFEREHSDTGNGSAATALNDSINALTTL
jgi:hypothetical protein